MHIRRVGFTRPGSVRVACRVGPHGSACRETSRGVPSSEYSAWTRARLNEITPLAPEAEELIDICGRKIKVQTGAKSQTVNICSSSNTHGQYDYIVRLRPPSVSPETLINQNFNSIRELVEYLESHHKGVIEKSPGARSASTTRAQGACHPLLDGVEEICSEYRCLDDRDGLFFRTFEKIRANWFRFREPARWPSAANWVLRVAPHFTYEPTKHFEKQLQKQIAICLENQGWGNDVPTASGLVDSQGRHINVDLAHRIEDGFEFVELKLDADDPYKAACQIARYGAIHMLYRLDPELTMRFRQNAMIRAKRIVLEVLAPFRYYSYSDVDLPTFERQLNAQLSAFAANYCAGLSLSFRFRAFLQSFVFEPSMDCGAIRDAVQGRMSPFVEPAEPISSIRFEDAETVEMRGFAKQQIRSFADWEQRALPPERKARQWKEGRSEFELARCWTMSGAVAVPPEIMQVLDAHEGTSHTAIKSGRTQHETPLPFGDRAPRCHDLLLLAERYGEVTAICVEAKADEPFGRTVAEELREARKRQGTRFPERLDWLTSSLLGIPAFRNGRSLELSDAVADLRYQLLTAVAGTLLEAKARQATTAILLVHEFRTHATDDGNLRDNAEALNRFMSAFYSHNGGPDEVVCLVHGQMLGPISLVKRPIAGLPEVTSEIPLFIGKIRTDRLAIA